MAAARNVSAAPKTTSKSCLFLNWWAIFPMLVVFPTPFTPTTIITCGLFSLVKRNCSSEVVLLSSKIRMTSSFKNLFNSSSLMYLSFSALSSRRSIIFTVVSKPTSLLINASSNSSKKARSTFVLPATALESLENIPCLVFCRPSFSFSLFCSCCSFFSSFLKKSNIPTCLLILI